MRVKLNMAEIEVFKVLIIKSQAVVKLYIIVTIAMCGYVHRSPYNIAYINKTVYADYRQC